MPLGRLGACNSEVLEAANILAHQRREYCKIIKNRPQWPVGGILGPHIVPPRNSIRWVPGPDQPFSFPAPPETGTDLLVFEEKVPEGYDGVLIGITNMWNGTGFIEGSGVITWRIKIDRYFIPYFDTILETRGSLAVPYDVVGQGIPLLSGMNVQYYVNFAVGSDMILNAGGKTICAATGYIWPREARVS